MKKKKFYAALQNSKKQFKISSIPNISLWLLSQWSGGGPVLLLLPFCGD